MDTSRISSVLDVERLRQSSVLVVGGGGSMTILEGLVRCGVGRVTVVDPDLVDSSNLARQGHTKVGHKKVRAAEEALRRINPRLDFLGIALKIEDVPESHLAEILENTDLIINATDSFPAQAFGNRLALKYGIPSMWIGIYANANAGEIVWWTPDHDDCFRCLLEHRFLAQAEQPGDPKSEGALIQDLQIVDGTAGHIALALLTRGSDNYFGSLIKKLGSRQFLQIKLRHDWLLAGNDPIRSALGVPEGNESYFCWNAATKENGPRIMPCPDCEELLGRTFSSDELVAIEVDQEIAGKRNQGISTSHSDLEL